MGISRNIVEVKKFTGVGYKPVLSYDAWRVAILNYIDELEPELIKKMQKHNETDESFILLKGRCILYFGTGEVGVEEISAIDMEPCKIYNVKKGVFHTHTPSKDAMVLIVENENTSRKNSPEAKLKSWHKKELIKWTENLWGKNWKKILGE